MRRAKGENDFVDEKLKDSENRFLFICVTGRLHPSMTLGVGDLANDCRGCIEIYFYWQPNKSDKTSFS